MNRPTDMAISTMPIASTSHGRDSQALVAAQHHHGGDRQHQSRVLHQQAEGDDPGQDADQRDEVPHHRPLPCAPPAAR